MLYAKKQKGLANKTGNLSDDLFRCILCHDADHPTTWTASQNSSYWSHSKFYFDGDYFLDWIFKFCRIQKEDMIQHNLFEPYQLGDHTLSNRFVMAPLTRRRAENPGLAPNDLIATYYRQRSSAGLIISEGSQISPRAYGYTHTPGCYTDEQLAGWEKVTAAVHDAGGKIFMQLWHVGPFSHKLLQPDGQPPQAASDIVPVGEVLTTIGRITYGEAKAMTQAEISQTVSDFGRAARNALQAGFDGVEVHGAHAYLIAFGKPFISNPDLVHRMKTGAPLTPPDEDTFYHGGEKGYTDYPFAMVPK